MIASTLGMGMSTSIVATANAATPSAVITFVGPPDYYSGTSSSGIVEEFNQYQSGAVGAATTGGPSIGSTTVTTNNAPTAIFDNAIEALATGNLAAIDNTTNIPASGLAVVVNQVNAPGLVVPNVTSTVTGGTISMTVSNGFTSGSAIIGSAGTSGGNTILAQTTLNSATNYVSGAIPLNLTATPTGSVVVNNTLANPVTTQGSVDLLTAQFNTQSQAGAGSNATVGGSSTIEALIDTDTTGAVINGAITLNNNTLSALYQGNYADTGIAPSGIGTFSGSLVLSTFQVNAPDSTTSGTTVGATNTGSSVYGQLVAASPGVDTLTGTLTITGSTISSTVSGNVADTSHFDATTGSALPSTGNVITLGSGLSFAGHGTLLTDNVQYPGGGAFSSSVTADIALANVQANLGAPLSALTTGATISADVQDMSLGSGVVKLASNSITSSAIGNIAYNEVIGGTGTESFTGTIGVQNVQTNDVADELHSSFTATVSGSSSIGAAVATAAFGGGTVAGATIEVGSTTAGLGNVIGAIAYGNQAGTFITLNYNSVTNVTADAGNLSGGGAPIGESVQGNRQSGNPHGDVMGIQSPHSVPVGFFSPGTAIINVQANLEGSGVAAVNAGSSIGLTVGDTVAVTGSTLGVDNNTIQSFAGGNSATIGFTVTAPVFVGFEAIGNAQSQEGIVTASLSGGTIGLTVVPDFSGSVASLTGNTLLSGVQGNYASNSLTLTTSSYTIDNGGGSTLRYTPSSPTPFDANAGADAYVNSGLALLNDQLVTTNITATNTTSGIVLTFEGALGTAETTATADNSSNRIIAQAQGNAALNTVSITASGGLASVASTGSSLGAIENVQQASTTAITASATTTGGSPILTTVAGVTTDAVVTLSSNEYLATAVANEATNTVNASGANSVNFDSSIAFQTVQITGPSFTSGQFYGFNIVNNEQYAGLGTVTAYARGGVEAELGSSGIATTGSTVTLDSNAFQATAFDNQATNSVVTSAGVSLGSTATAFNNQISFADTTASAGSFFLPTTVSITAHDVTDSALTITNTHDFATAYANTATTSVTATSGNGATTSVGTLPTMDQGVNWLSGYGSGSGIGADYVVGNLQQSSGNLLAYATGNQRVVTFGTIDDVTTTVSHNIVQADAEANVATNALVLSIANGSAVSGPTAAVGSLQLGLGAPTTDATQTVIARAAGTFSVTNLGSITGSSITTSSNAINAIAQLNSATNSLTVSSGNSLGSPFAAGFGAAQVTLGITPDLDTSSSTADFAISNVQASTGAIVSATASTGSFFTPSGINLLFDDLSNLTLTVSSNQVFAQAGVNTATNTLTVTADNQGASTGSVLNLQSNASAATSAVGGILGITAAGFNATTVATATLSVGDNHFVAQSWGNSATNSLTATATNGFAVADPVLTVTDTGPNTVEAGQVILNQQLNGGAVSASAGFTAIGVLAGSGSITGTTISVTGNMVQTTAAGNNATNSLVLNGNNGSGAIGNAQINTGAINASVGGVGIGVIAGGFNGSGTISGGALNVSDNTVTAVATGNAAVNNLVLNNSQNAVGGISSTQFNSGPVNASIAGVAIGLASSGSLSGTPTTISGNQIIAMATGNSVVTTIKH